MGFCIMFEELKFKGSLGSDNHSAVHPRVMEALLSANRGGAHAYGLDELSELCDGEFKRVFGEQAETHLVFTGTAANVLCLSPALRSFQSVICSEVAHLNVDECAAPEKFWGGKLLTVPSKDGKIKPAQMGEHLSRGGDQHFAQPRAVSLTQPTELGVCYTLEELREWRKFTREKGLLLHIDGARLANAAAFLNCDLKAMTTGIGVDAVSFGGTKNGLMGAEACVLFNPELKKNFKFYRKQAMQLSSKTRFLAAQFYAYLKDDLWLEIARHAHDQARKLAKDLQQFERLKLRHPVQSNALFVEMPREWVDTLKQEYFFYVWDQSTNLVRWMTSFSWTDKDSERLITRLKELR
jgi:threonine aldolase